MAKKVKVLIELTLKQALALEALADEGAEGLLTDPEAAKGYLGGRREIEAAEDALEALRLAINAAGRPSEPPEP